MNRNIEQLIKRIEPVGSRVTCNPAPTDTDEDFLVLVNGNDYQELLLELHEDGFEIGGSEVYSAEEYQLESTEGFQSFKKGITNYIITCNEEFFSKFMKATTICKTLNVLNKEDRIRVFQWELYGVEVSNGIV